MNSKYFKWWAKQDSNPQPRDYESPALTIELFALNFHELFHKNHDLSTRIFQIFHSGGIIHVHKFVVELI